MGLGISKSLRSRCDVAIVGAGPAGAWAAYTLARRGARVTMFDPSHPREKPCGGGVTGRALALVDDAVGAARFPHCVIRSARFVDSESGQSAGVSLDPGRAATDSSLIVASRAVFDAALLAGAQRAGATLETARVRHLRVEAGGVRIETAQGTHRADVVIGADGANSLVRRSVAQPFTRRQLSIATGYFAHGVTSDEIIIELILDPPGYLWSFPRPDHLAIGICAQADTGVTAHRLRARAAAWIRDAHLTVGAELESYSWPIPSLTVRDLQTIDLAGPSWCLVGDAAGLVDPITREGIYFALASGALAADAIAAGDLVRYAADVERELVRELVLAARLKAGFFRPDFTELLVRGLQGSGAIREVMADIVAGRQSYAGLKWRLLTTMEWRLAWKMLVSARNSHRARERERRDDRC